MGKRIRLRKRKDKLGDLPLNILDMIISKLPLKEAIKTSILSKQWKNKWQNLSNFVLKGKGDNSYDFDYDSSTYSDSYMVHQYLGRHNESIAKFALREVEFNQKDLRSWLKILLTRNIKSLILDKSRFGYHEISKFPSSFFSFKQLQKLKLCHLSLKIPQEFRGFKALKSLSLKGVGIDEKELEKLIQDCCSLEKLKLLGMYDMDDRDDMDDVHDMHDKNILTIRWENLKYVKFENGNLLFEDTKNLSSLCCSGYPDKNMWNLLFEADSSLSNLEILRVHIETFYGFSKVGNGVKKHDHLSVLEINCSVYLNYHLRTFLEVLGYFPNLKKLSFAMSYDKYCLDFEIPKDLEPLNLKKLEEISVHFSMKSPIYVLVLLLCFFTKNAPLLKTVEIRRDHGRSEQVNDKGEILGIHIAYETLHRRLTEISPQLKIIHRLPQNYYEK